MHYKIAAAAIAAAGLTLAGGSAASAAPTPANVIGPVVGTTDGTAGITSTWLGHFYNSTEATFDLTSQAQNLGTTTSLTAPNGAQGIGLCNNGSGFAAETGALYTGSAFEIAYALGGLKPNGADPCRNNGVLNTGAVLHPLLSNLAVGDSVTLLISQYAAGVVFSGQDNSTGQSFDQYVATTVWHAAVWHPGHWVAGHWVGTPGHRTWIKGFWIAGHLTPGYRTGIHPYYNESLTGVMQNLRNLGGPATNDLVDFSGIFVDGVPLTLFNDQVVDSSGTGGSPWLAGVATSTTTGPNGEACTLGSDAKIASDALPAGPPQAPWGYVAPAALTPSLTAGGPQNGPLTTPARAGSAFSVCVSTATGA